VPWGFLGLFLFGQWERGNVATRVVSLEEVVDTGILYDKELSYAPFDSPVAEIRVCQLGGRLVKVRLFGPRDFGLLEPLSPFPRTHTCAHTRTLHDGVCEHGNAIEAIRFRNTSGFQNRRARHVFRPARASGTIPVRLVSALSPHLFFRSNGAFLLSRTGGRARGRAMRY
jgi:hypothetical protein